MKCPICLIHYNSSDESSNIMFNGFCSNCSQGEGYFFNNDIDEITEEEAFDNNLRIVNPKKEFLDE